MSQESDNAEMRVKMTLVLNTFIKSFAERAPSECRQPQYISNRQKRAEASRSRRSWGKKNKFLAEQGIKFWNLQHETNSDMNVKKLLRINTSAQNRNTVINTNIIRKCFLGSTTKWSAIYLGFKFLDATISMF